MTQPKDPTAETASEWQPIVSGNAELKLSTATATAGGVPALRMDFDFKGAGGFVVARRSMKRSMPQEYAVSFSLRGRGLVNDLELKLVDDTGLNVWRHVLNDLRLPHRWKRFTIESHQVEFAWGPASGSSIATLGSLELAIVARDGGGGSLWISDPRIEDRDPKANPLLSASSESNAFEASHALGASGWKPFAADVRPWLLIDLTELRTLGGLIIDWLDMAPARGFSVRSSRNGRRWLTSYRASEAAGKRSYVYLPALKTRFLRLEVPEPFAGAKIALQSFEFSRSIHAFWYAIAAAETRGWHPRWLHREQSLWTPVGTANGLQCALLNEDGMVEVAEGSFSLEPMLWVEDQLFTWADGASRLELLDGYMPLPAVVWETARWRLLVRAEASEGNHVRVRYSVQNISGHPCSFRLFVLVRPFQVTPPWQNFRKLGGVSPIHALHWQAGALDVGGLRLFPDRAPTGFAALSFDGGFMASHLAAGELPQLSEANDPFGFATGALRFDAMLAPQEHFERVIGVGQVNTHVAATGAPMSATAPLDVSLIAPVFAWAAILPLEQWRRGPQVGREPDAVGEPDTVGEPDVVGEMGKVVRAALTATAHILITRSGPALQPGPRRYTRSWIRDGAMMSAALLRMGCADEVREFIRWYAPHQRADGFVPCCIDAEGVDWLVEHDSHGQLIAVISDYYQFTADRNFLLEAWIFVDRAVACIEALLGSDGLLPISVSHEGYLAQPVHSYWDDFWALRGLRDAAELARHLGHADVATRWTTLCARFSATLFESIAATRVGRKLDFIPGSIEWADFDPTATANAIYLLDVPAELGRDAVEQTFDKYMAAWRSKRGGSVPSANYTPYEIRIIGALVRLGRRDDALELLRFFLSDRRPPAWNQWPEIAWSDHTAPAHIGDLPHTWIAAEFVLAVRCMFGYERETDDSLVLAAGLAPEWIKRGGVTVTTMPTARGRLSYSLREVDSNTLRFDISGGIDGKLVLAPPLPGPLSNATVNGAAHAEFDARSVTIRSTPAVVTCTTWPTH